jgi:ATP-binding cassette, subfamily G (WHITE), member 2, SNQ2
LLVSHHIVQGFYSASADVMAQVMVQAIITIAETLIFAPILYCMVGLSTEGGAGRFFIFLAILIATNLNLAAYFRSIAAIMPNFSAAQTIGK